MSEKYLTDEELRTVIAKFHDIPRFGWETGEQRAVATAASDKGYAVGIQDAAAWLRSFNDVSFPVGTYLADTLLAEKGAR
jgi:hypothetical protein